jgi:CheY-like chemotaxis protein
MTFLIVDDNQFCIKPMITVLEKSIPNADFRTAKNGVEAITEYRSYFA